MDQKDQEINSLNSKLLNGLDQVYYSVLTISSENKLNMKEVFNGGEFQLIGNNYTSTTVQMKVIRPLKIFVVNVSPTSGNTGYIRLGKRDLNNNLNPIRTLYSGYKQEWGYGPMPTNKEYALGLAMVSANLNTLESLEFYDPYKYSSDINILLLIGLTYL